MNGKVLVTLVCVVVLMGLTGCGEVLTPEIDTPTPSAMPTGVAAPVNTEAAPAVLQPIEPTSTPTLTPTPVIHVIQSGDTLGGIAVRYGVSVQALQALNGIENPLLLQIGQELVIPTGDEDVEAPITGLLLPTPTPLPFDVRGSSLYQTPVGSLWSLGEVVNTTSYTITNVLVQVILFDAGGAPLTQGSAFAAAEILPPGARAPFGLLFVSPPPGVAGQQATILRGEFAGQLSGGYVPLRVDEFDAAASGPQTEVTGMVRNTDPARTMGRVTVVVTTYDADGLVTGYRQQPVDIEGGLAPGGTISFRLLLTAHAPPPADLSVFAIGRIQE